MFLSTSKTALPENAPLPGFAQYAGKMLTRANGASIEDRDELLTPFLLGAYLYPSNDVVRFVLKKSGKLSRYDAVFRS